MVLPSDDLDVLAIKLSKYAEASVLVWVVFPDRLEVDVHAPNEAMKTLGLDDTLNGGDVLPGFELLVREIFPE